jgi:hypothetical protein
MAADAAPAAAKKGSLGTILKAALTIAVFAALLYKVDLRATGARLAAIRLPDLLLVTALTCGQVALSAARWWRLLRTTGERPGYLSVLGDVNVGILYNMVLPTSVGGDVVRALRARGRCATPHHAWSTSIYERIAGLVAMGLTAALAMALGSSAVGALGTPLRALVLVLAAVFLVAFFAASAPFRLLVRVFEQRLPQVARDDLRGITEDLEGPLARSAVRVEALAWSVLYQAVTMGFVIAGAHAMGETSHDAALLVGMPLVYVLSMVPLTLGGHGLREGLYVGILGALGVASDVALGLAGIWLLACFGFSVVGVFVAVLAPVKRPEGAGAAAA